jgi:cysteinyl-tRNA synthetase
MAERHLGRTIDIHGGGNDLIFPHHENELAQSTCAHGGETFVRFWLHNGFVNVDHTKMSKSLGNVMLVRELLKQAPGEAIRLALLSGHYRQPLDWTGDVLPDAKRKLDRLYQTLRDLPEVADASGEPDPDFVAALEDDLNTPKALAALFDLARDLNRSETGPARLELAGRLRASAALLGILRESPAEWFMRGADGELDAARVEALLADRRDARARRDFAAADRIRDELIRGGILIEDGPEGTRWRRAG